VHFRLRHIGLTVAISVAASGLFAIGPSAAPAAAAVTRRCSTHPARTANDFQAVADNRNANFGIGDITSVVRLPDGRLFFTLGDTAYYDVLPDGRAGPWKAFGNNSAWVQSGNCFTLLQRTRPGVRTWLLPPQYDGSVYWPAASVVVGPRLYVFLNRLLLEPPFGRSVGSAVAVFDLPPSPSRGSRPSRSSRAVSSESEQFPRTG
jgi:hypothetical protein